MKILHVVPTYLPATRYGGPIYSVHGLCKALVAKGHEVHVFTTTVDGDLDSEVPINEGVNIDGVQVWYFPTGTTSNASRPMQNPLFRRISRRLYFSPGMKDALISRIDEFDVVHLHSVFLWPTFSTARIAHAVSVPYVLSPRGMLVRELVKRKSRWLKTAWLRIIEKKTIAQAARLHVTSENELAELSCFSFDLPAVVNIGNGVELPDKWEKADLSGDVADVIGTGQYVLYLGRLNWKKGLDRLLFSWAKVTGWQLVIAGNDEENYLPDLKRIAAEVDVLDRVTFLSRSISGDDKEALLQSASTLVLPSYSENFGNVVPEAMVRGVPVIVTEEVGAKEIVKKSGGGVVTSEDLLSSKITALLDDEETRNHMGEKGKEWIRGSLTWDKVADDMEHCYLSSVNQDR
ncbi:glycosyltransferase [Pseudomonadota bacterium]